MSAHEAIDKVNKVGSGDLEDSSLDKMSGGRVAPDKAQFDSAMASATNTGMVTPEVDPATKVSKASLMDEIRDLNRRVDFASKATPEKLQAQVQTVIAQIEDIKGKLQTPQLEIKSSVRDVLSNKLTSIDDKLKIALDKAGLDYVAPPERGTGLSGTAPIERFLGMLTDGQNKLNTLSNDVAKYADADGQISPASLLAVQIKVGYIQQELEFFASLLNKSLESIKTVMNVQV